MEPPAPASASAERHYRNVTPQRLADGTYIIHSSMKRVRNLCVYRNGLRMKPALDYEYAPASGIIKPLFQWSAESTILCDFDL